MHIYLFVLPVFRYIFWWSTRLFIRVPHLHIFLFTTYCIIHGKKLHIETLVDELLKDARYCMILLPVWIAWCSFNFSWPEKVSFCVTSVKILFFFGWMFPLVQCCALNWVLACMTVNGRMRRDKELIRSEGTESNKPKGDFTSKLFWRLFILCTCYNANFLRELRWWVHNTFNRQPPHFSGNLCQISSVQIISLLSKVSMKKLWKFLYTCI